MPCDNQLAETRKRKSIVQHASTTCKKQKLSDQSYQPQSRAEFWDSLSKVWLTKHALGELDRRTKRSAHRPQEPLRPRTRSYCKQVLQQKSFTPASAFLDHSALRTLDKIRTFARHGGPDLTEVRGYPEPAYAQAQALKHSMSSSRSSGPLRDRKRGSASSSRTRTTAITGKTKRSIPKDANHQQRLIDGGVYPYGYKYPDGRRVLLPPDWNDMRRRLAQPRPSLSPSRFQHEQYQDFVDADAAAHNEAEVKDPVLPNMLRAMHATSGACKDQMFTTLDPIVSDIARAKPDYYYGAQHEQITKNVREKLHGYIIPSEQTPAVPNFSLEAKGPNGSLAEALRQACHNGAIGARAVHSLQTYGEEDPLYDNRVRSISSIYHGGQLRLYGHSVAQPGGPGTRPEYYMHQIRTLAMTDDQESFLQGATVYKNAVDMMREFRTAAMEHANAIDRRQTAAVQEAVQEDEDSSDDENEDEGEDGLAPVICPSFMAYSANASAVTEAEEDNDEDGSETSVEADHHGPPAKRPSSKSQSSSRRRSHKSSSTSTSKEPRRKSWFGW